MTLITSIILLIWLACGVYNTVVYIEHHSLDPGGLKFIRNVVAFGLGPILTVPILVNKLLVLVRKPKRCDNSQAILALAERFRADPELAREFAVELTFVIMQNGVDPKVAGETAKQIMEAMFAVPVDSLVQA